MPQQLQPTSSSTASVATSNFSHPDSAKAPLIPNSHGDKAGLWDSSSMQLPHRDNGVQESKKTKRVKSVKTGGTKKAWQSIPINSSELSSIQLIFTQCKTSVVWYLSQLFSPLQRGSLFCFQNG